MQKNETAALVAQDGGALAAQAPGLSIEELVRAALEQVPAEQLASYESGLSLADDYLTFDPEKDPSTQSRRLMFLEVSERPSTNEDGTFAGMVDAAIFLDLFSERIVFGMQKKLVGICQQNLETGRLAPGYFVEVRFLGVKKRKNKPGHFQDFDILPLRAPQK